MEAIDTEMSDDAIKKELVKYDIPEVFIDEEACQRLITMVGNIISIVRKAQAEISLKAGRAEVVEWIEKENPFSFIYRSSTTWQTKLKEWEEEELSQ